MKVELYNDEIMDATLKKLDRACKFNVTLYLLGGSAMIQIGSKATTKDIDIVLKEQMELDHLMDALLEIGFEHMETETEEELIRTAIHFQDRSGFKFDVFLGNIAGKLEFSDSMRERAVSINKLQHLDIRRLSNEDLFLLKSVSGRDIDLEDMSKLFQTGLDWDIIISELKTQTKITKRIWTVIFLDSITDLEKEYNLHCPRLKEITDIVEVQLGGITKLDL